MVKGPCCIAVVKPNSSQSQPKDWKLAQFTSKSTLEAGSGGSVSKMITTTTRLDTIYHVSSKVKLA
jgi:hypothetical protein